MKKLIFSLLSCSMFVLFSCNEGPASPEVPVVVDSTTNSTPTIAPAAGEKSKKKALLKSLVGEYTLQSIDGFTGANTMMEFRLVEGKWTASGSSNSGGTREGFDMDLTDEDLNKLQTAKIVVAEDLSVSYICDGVRYLTAPFKENGMEFSLSQAPKEYYSANMPDSLTAASTFHNGTLYLYAKDKISEQEIEPADIAQVMADAMLLKFHQADNTFELMLFYGDCCDNSIYIFQ